MFSNPFIVNGQQFYLTASIGVSFFPSDTREVGGLFRLSDIAMYHAKEAAQASHAFYQSSMSREIKHRLHQFDNVRDIIIHRDFRILLKPVFNVHNTNSCTFITSIDSKEPPTRHLLKIADMKRLGNDLVLAVIDECIQLKQHLLKNQPSGDKSVFCVRLLPSQLANTTFIDQFFLHIKALGCDLSWLTFELPEDVLLYKQNLHVFLKSAMSLGIKVHLVDFGHQYSHVGILKEFSSCFAAICISSYYLELIHEPRNQELLQSIVDMCRIFTPEVYIQNISNQIQHQACIKAGVDCLEGSFLGAPCFLEDLYQKNAFMIK